MNHKFDAVARSLARPNTSRRLSKQLGLGVAGTVLACLTTLPVTGGQSVAPTSTTSDPAGDAHFPYDLYGAAVPPYLDVIGASVSLTAREVFQLEITVSAEIPSDADPGFTPAVNHLGVTFGILTDPDTKGEPYKFFGHSEVYRFNFLVGALYSVTDSGVGLGLGWTGFIIGPAGVTELPLKIKQNKFILELSADAIGSPTSFDWAVASECDPVSVPEEGIKTAVLVDFAPDSGVSTWPPGGN